MCGNEKNILRPEQRPARILDRIVRDATLSIDAKRRGENESGVPFPPPLAGENVRRAGEGRRFRGNERLGKRGRRPSSAFDTFSFKRRRKGELGPSAPSSSQGKGTQKGNSSAAPFSRAMSPTRVGSMIEAVSGKSKPRAFQDIENAIKIASSSFPSYS
jgi:hypothetical protein